MTPNAGAQTKRSPGFDLDALYRRSLVELARGLTSTRRWTSPVWLYDARGGALFDEITRLPEYYPTRAERSILHARADAIAERSACRSFVELGAGTSEKTRVLLDAMHRRDLVSFVPVDVDESTLTASAAELAIEYPNIDIVPTLGDFNDLEGIKQLAGPRLVAFLGSTIGNFAPPERKRFLFDLDCVLERGDHALIGFDLVKDPQRLVAAYDDTAGVTAEFNLNVLSMINREVDGNFDPAAFEHRAVWDPVNQWIEMRLRARRAMTVRLDALQLEIDIAEGEEIRTEISAKFTEERIRSELYEAGLVIDSMWFDDGHDFSLVLARPYC